MRLPCCLCTHRVNIINHITYYTGRAFLILELSNAGLGMMLSLLGSILSLISSNAYAYLDPGAISLVLQAITAAVAGAVLTGKYWFWRVLDLLGIKKRREESDNHNPATPDDE